VSTRSKLVLAALTGLGALGSAPAQAEEATPSYLADRGTGVPTSMFATYVRRGELLVYPFLEYYYDSNAEYKPAELGYGLEQDFRGKYEAVERLVFLSYGITDFLAIEIEAATINARLEKSPSDPSSTPSEIKEGGLGDVEGQLRGRWLTEGRVRPELFSYFETVLPTARGHVLIGTPDWELKLGTGVTKGFSFGTFTIRAAVEHDRAANETALGEAAVEWVKRLSPAFRVYLGVEGSEDEWEGIGEIQWHFHRQAYLKLNNSFGLTSKATDYAPELGVMFTFPVAR